MKVPYSLSFIVGSAIMTSLFFAGCKKDETKTDPVLTIPVLAATKAITAITETTASSGGNVTATGGSDVLARGVCYDTMPSPTFDNDHDFTSDGSGTGTFTSLLTELKPGKKYYVRAFATNLKGVAYGTELNFTTLKPVANLPVITSLASVTNITATEASFGGNITTGNGSIIARGVCWNTAGSPTVSLTTKTSDGTGIGNFTSSITGLTSNTTYKVRAYATNANGTGYGNEETFTTSILVTVPVLGPTTSATNITVNAATSGGNITSDGNGTITARGVCWGTSPDPTISGSKTSDGTGTGSFTSNLTGLMESTTYYVRSYATNSAGTGYGAQASFTTSALTVTDIDGNVYQTVKIGGQTWMKENLKTSKYRDGSVIPTSLSDNAWQSTTAGAYSIYNNDAANNTTYGKLYNWNAVTDSRNLCPTGWHVPSDAEWTTLENFLGGTGVAGGKMKTTTGWTSPNAGATNESGFSGLPGGYRYLSGTYYYIGNSGNWWSSSEHYNTTARFRNLSNYLGDSYRGDDNKHVGYSVRCLRD